jgi:hypothetical protein
MRRGLMLRATRAHLDPIFIDQRPSQLRLIQHTPPIHRYNQRAEGDWDGSEFQEFIK